MYTYLAGWVLSGCGASTSSSWVQGQHLRFAARCLAELTISATELNRTSLRMNTHGV